MNASASIMRPMALIRARVGNANNALTSFEFTIRTRTLPQSMCLPYVR